MPTSGVLKVSKTGENHINKANSPLLKVFNVQKTPLNLDWTH